MTPVPLVVLKSVSFSYDNVRWVLNRVSLEIFKGERVTVLGHNGSGKSTLVKILGALQVPSQGACFICGLDTSDSASLFDIHKRVGLVFQNPESQIVAAVVEDDVAFALENQGLASNEIEKKICWALEKTGLLNKRGALSSALSGGEKQRLALAGALAASAECLVLDEPTAMLDPEGRVEVENVLRDIHKSGATIIQVSHRLEDAIHADRVLVLSHGSWAWQGSKEDFLRGAESLGFKLPPMLELGRRFFTLGVTPPETVEDTAEAIIKVINLKHEALPREQKEQKEQLKGLSPLRIPYKKHHPKKALINRDSQGPEALGWGLGLSPSAVMFDVRGLGYSFGVSTPVETQVLRDVSCAVPKGRWTSVLGRTGSGKSTLIQHLNGLYNVQSGEIFIESGNNIEGGNYIKDDGKLVPIPAKGEALRYLRRRVGLVFQSPEDQLFSPTVREELAFAPLNWGFSEEEARASAERALHSVGLVEEYLDRSPLRLSGGERRLVAIASVLSADPECLILDEPTAGLDMSYREEIVELLSRLRDTGKTIITVTHDFEMAFEQSDHLIVMDNGRKICEGDAGDILPGLLETDAVMLPEVLRISALLRARGLDVPLTWRAGEIMSVLS